MGRITRIAPNARSMPTARHAEPRSGRDGEPGGKAVGGDPEGQPRTTERGHAERDLGRGAPEPAHRVDGQPRNQAPPRPPSRATPSIAAIPTAAAPTSTSEPLRSRSAWASAGPTSGAKKLPTANSVEIVAASRRRSTTTVPRHGPSGTPSRAGQEQRTDELTEAAGHDPGREVAEHDGDERRAEPDPDARRREQRLPAPDAEHVVAEVQRRTAERRRKRSRRDLASDGRNIGSPQNPSEEENGHEEPAGVLDTLSHAPLPRLPGGSALNLGQPRTGVNL